MNDNTVSIDAKAAEHLDAIRFSLFNMLSRMLEAAKGGEDVDAAELRDEIECVESGLAKWMTNNGFYAAFAMHHLPEPKQ